MSTASTPLVLATEAARESDISFCLIGVQAVPVQDAIAEAELTELFEVFSSINEAWEGLDQRGVSTMFINTVDTAPLAGVPPLAQAARNRVSVLVEVAGDPPVLVTQIALCDIGQLLLAHASAVR